MYAKYKQRCMRCKKEHVLITSRKQYPVCKTCQMKQIDKPIENPEMNKILDIDRDLYEQSSFLRSIRSNYNQYGNLSERQIQMFERVVEELKNPQLLERKTIYLLRHGESEGNVNRVLPSPNTPLTEKGKKQAYEMAAYFSDKEVDVIYSSTAVRSAITAGVIAQGLRRKVIKKAALQDTKMGSFKGASIDEPDIHKMLVDRKNPRLPTPKDVEGFTTMQGRIREFYDKMIEGRSRHIIIVSHLDVTRILLALLLDLELKDVMVVMQPNDCLYIIDIATKKVTYHWKKKDHDGFLTSEPDTS